MGAQVGVTAGLALPLLVSISLFFLERRKRQRAEAKLIKQNIFPPSESEQEGLRRDTLCSYEVNAEVPSVELSSQRPVHELSH